jgi:hypothetical protein
VEGAGPFLISGQWLADERHFICAGIDLQHSLVVAWDAVDIAVRCEIASVPFPLPLIRRSNQLDGVRRGSDFQNPLGVGRNAVDKAVRLDGSQPLKLALENRADL